MPLFSASPQTSTSSGTSTTNFTPDPNVTAGWQLPLQTAGGLAQWAVNNPMYQGQMVAPATDIMQQYWQRSGDTANFPPNVGPNNNAITAAAGDMYNQQVNPNTINLPQYNAQSFQPGALNMPQFGNVPTVNAPGAATPAAYQTQQVQAPQI